MNTIRYIDLFCGLGAFHTAFNTDSRLECVFACDIDEGVRKIYKDNYRIDVEGDIRELNIDTIPEFQLLCAGFPCQPFSIAGNGEGFKDKEKGNLFYNILQIIDKKSPKMCILENVKNLATHDEGKTFKTIESELLKRGYMLTWKILNASDYGSPQARQRIYIVATKGKAFCIPEGSKITTPVSSIIDLEVDDIAIPLEKYTLLEKKTKGTNIHTPKILYDIISKETKKGGRQGERVYDISHVGITICASSGGPGAKTGLYKIGNNIRRLTVKESLAMFGFPSTYIINTKEEKALSYLGNSIVVNVLTAFVPLILEWFSI
jgi:DNA (cytosine-5)-methyltransferase 1